MHGKTLKFSSIITAWISYMKTRLNSIYDRKKHYLELWIRFFWSELWSADLQFKLKKRVSDFRPSIIFILIIIIIIIIPLFFTFGDKNYGNITIKIQNTTYLYTYQIQLSLAPLGINDCLCVTCTSSSKSSWSAVALEKLVPRQCPQATEH